MILRRDDAVVRDYADVAGRRPQVTRNLSFQCSVAVTRAKCEGQQTFVVLGGRDLTQLRPRATRVEVIAWP